MINLRQSRRYALALAVAGSILLSGCGEDPATDSASTVMPSEPAADTSVTQGLAAPAGVLPKLDPSIVAPTGNGKAKCNIETIAGQGMETSPPVIPKSVVSSLVGWYVDVAGKGTGNGLLLVIHNEDHSKSWVVPISERTDRQDVADSIDGSNDYVKSGFSLALDLSSLPVGYYGAYLTDSHSSMGACALGRTFGLE